MLALARRHIGEPCRGALAPKPNSGWRGPWSNAEFAAWLVFQEAHILYGCADNAADPTLAAADLAAWRRDAFTIGQVVPAEVAVATPGAFLLRFGPAAGLGHIAVSDGGGGTVEARGVAYGVVVHTAQGRHWDAGVLIPHIAYEPPAPEVGYHPPASLYGPGWANMDAGIVAAIQRALAAQSLDPGPIDGEFGMATALAVAGFQAMTGLVIDGQVGADTAHALSVGLMVRR
jgi:hypothetical protein